MDMGGGGLRGDAFGKSNDALLGARSRSGSPLWSLVDVKRWFWQLKTVPSRWNMAGRIPRARCMTRRVNSGEKKQTGKKEEVRGKIYRKKHGRLYKHRLTSLKAESERKETREREKGGSFVNIREEFHLILPLKLRTRNKRSNYA